MELLGNKMAKAIKNPLLNQEVADFFRFMIILVRSGLSYFVSSKPTRAPLALLASWLTA